MPIKEVKKRSITAKLVPNKLTQRDDDYTCNVVYIANRTIQDICRLAEPNSKFSASELESAYNDLLEAATNELYSGSTVEFGFSNNSLGVDGIFVGPKAEFDPTKNSVTLRCIPRTEFKKDLEKIGVIITTSEELLPTITTVTDVTTGSVNSELTPGGGLNGTGSRVRIAGTEGNTVGFIFVSADNETETPVPATSLLRNDPSNFSFVIPQLANGTYYLDIVTQSSGNNQFLLKEPRRNRFPYPLYVGGKPDEGEEEEERPGGL